MVTQISIDNVRQRLQALLVDTGGDEVVGSIAPLLGGASSLTYLVELTLPLGGSSRVVLKVAPPGLMPTGHRDVLRQARVLMALDRRGTLPVPAVVLIDEGAPPAIPPMFAMAFVEGDSTEPLFDWGPKPIDEHSQDTHEMIARRAHQAARNLATLQASEVDSLLGTDQPRLFGTDEVDRWSAALRSVQPSLVPEWEACRDDLLACVPAPLPEVITHGDYRLGNMLASGDEVRAVIDWEIWSIGDPRMDLGWLRLNADPQVYRRRTMYGDAMPSPDDLLRTYELARGSVSDLAWFDALSRFKTVAIWSLILKRARGDAAAQFADLPGSLPHLLTSARSMLR